MPTRIIVQVFGLANDDLHFQKEIENSVVQTARDNRRSPTHLDEITVVVKYQQHNEREVKYFLTIRAAGKVEQFIAKAWGDTLPSAIEELDTNFRKALRKEQPPQDTPKMWGHFRR
ncbi:MAG: hypothetical protein JSV76_01335 [Candidatus Bathyarchaeota archaeon]|nr:MAG: hypothetical protein JSV76_01335 [Candidatus Bathyarchaeota archaeon]